MGVEWEGEMGRFGEGGMAGLVRESLLSLRWEVGEDKM